ncbi:hypothetical protein [Bartonella harrusi]|uniref:Uncharacterized protein n=1 Tax=Bartonella harrusi TaxID=2961895 RepID=A0ABY5EUR0_9HYPH|nr:hypothetical protein [Bartonella harrusi]UTO28228.1 hypothetical protein NMK50_08775 [Bartonella harrusi]
MRELSEHFRAGKENAAAGLYRHKHKDGGAQSIDSGFMTRPFTGATAKWVWVPSSRDVFLENCVNVQHMVFSLGVLLFVKRRQNWNLKLETIYKKSVFSFIERNRWGV